MGHGGGSRSGAGAQGHCAWGTSLSSSSSTTRDRPRMLAHARSARRVTTRDAPRMLGGRRGGARDGPRRAEADGRA
eukprot:3289470-Rhodomonas_salina.1